MDTVMWAIILGGLLSIVYGAWTIQAVMAADAGSARMQEIAAAIQEGAPPISRASTRPSPSPAR